MINHAIDWISAHGIALVGLAIILWAIWPRRRSCGCGVFFPCKACEKRLAGVDKEIEEKEVIPRV